MFIFFLVQNVCPSALGQICFILLPEWQLCQVRRFADVVGAFSAVPPSGGEVEGESGSAMFVLWSVVSAVLFLGAVVAAVLRKK